MSKVIKKYNIRKGTVFVPVSDLGFFDNNPKKFESKQYKKLLESVKKNGIRENLLVNKTTMTILNGNQRFKVSLQLGLKEVLVTFIEVPEKDEAKVLIELNECLTTKDDEAMEKLIRKYQDDELMKMFLDDYEKFKKDVANDYNPEFEIVKEIDENYNYIVFISKRDVDFLNIETFFNLEKVYDLHKEKNIGLGRTISADKLLKLISFASAKGLKNIDDLD